MLKFFKFSIQVAQNTTKYASVRNVACSQIQCIDQRWREAKGLPENPNAFGPLTNLPDYTFMDGRPTPMGSNQKTRLKRQQEVANKIVQLCDELDFAKQRYARIKAEQVAKKKHIMENKLKPKGHLLLNKKE